MNLAVIGSGGREHSICYKLKKSQKVKKLICIPGNAGTKGIAENIDANIHDFNQILEIIKSQKIDIAIIGPEEPLVNGIVDFLAKNKIKVLGPNKFASQLEGSKAFMKDLCKKNNIPTAKFGTFDNYDHAINFLNKSRLPIVIKADGLAAGKGVSICKDKEDAKKQIYEIINGKFKSSKTVILEEFLEGEELSYFILVDKNSYSFFGSAQDHKKVGEGDTGPNTGGMGAYSPSNLLTKKLEIKIKNKIIEPTLNAMRALGHPFKGFLYAGLMISKGEPFLIEYNIRMGDPECQVLMMRLKTDLLEIVEAAISDNLEKISIEWYEEDSITIVLCAKGYPGKYIKNSEIKNINKIVMDVNNQVFHAGTYEKNNKIFSKGGRVLNITAKEKKLINARNRCLINLDKLNWKDGFYRKDIGWRAIKGHENN